MIDSFKAILLGNEALDVDIVRLLSLVFLLLSGMMSFFTYTRKVDLWIFSWDSELTFKPGFVSTLLAVFMIAPLYLRGILQWNVSIYGVVSLLLILLVFSSFVELVLGSKTRSPLIMGLLGSALVLSWLGIKEVAGIAWILVLAGGIYSVIISNIALGFYGFIYVAFGFVGLVLHSGLNPGELVQGIKMEYSTSTQKAVDEIHSDIHGLKSP